MVLDDRRDKTTLVNYFACVSCGVVSKESDVSKLFEYYSQGWHSGNDIPRSPSALEATASWICSALEPWAMPKMKLAIDVGSKSIRFLEIMQKRLGFEKLKAIDPNPASKEVERGWWGDGVRLKTKVNFLVASHVLEHTINPKAFVLDCSRNMSGSAIAYIEVPSLEEMVAQNQQDLILSCHLWHFTQPALHSLFQQAGLLVMDSCHCVDPDGYPISRNILVKPPIYSPQAMMNRACWTQDHKYSIALTLLSSCDPSNIALYGASDSYLRLLEIDPSVKRFDVYDKYKGGLIFNGKRIRRTKRITHKTVYVVPRNTASFKAIARSLKEEHPSVECLSLWGFPH